VLIELVDDLRCPRPHEETWLVASADRAEGRDIVEGMLGCPICHAEYPIREGVVWFTEPRDMPPRTDPLPSIDAELTMRLAAFLDLSDAQGFALLAGSWGAAAPLLRDVVPTHLVLLNPTAGVVAGDAISVLRIGSGIPLAAATCRGVALDAGTAEGDYLDAAIRVLRPRGRLVAPASTPIPPDVTELARDERLWVAERVTAPPQLVTLRPREGR
jgi:hypothetical protein